MWGWAWSDVAPILVCVAVGGVLGAAVGYACARGAVLAITAFGATLGGGCAAYVQHSERKKSGAALNGKDETIKNNEDNIAERDTTIAGLKTQVDDVKAVNDTLVREDQASSVLEGQMNLTQAEAKSLSEKVKEIMRLLEPLLPTPQNQDVNQPGPEQTAMDHIRWARNKLNNLSSERVQGVLQEQNEVNQSIFAVQTKIVNLINKNVKPCDRLDTPDSDDNRSTSEKIKSLEDSFHQLEQKLTTDDARPNAGRVGQNSMFSAEIGGLRQRRRNAVPGNQNSR